MRADHESKFDAIQAAKEGRPVLFTGEVMLLCFRDDYYYYYKFALDCPSLFMIRFQIS